MPNRPKRSDSPHAAAAKRLGQQLRAARKKQLMSQQQLAEQAGVSIGTVRAMESRSVDPSFFTVLALSRAVALDPEQLIRAVIQDTDDVSSYPNS